jgi:TRAP-type mannitol/chloroaromatic compound transport system substrate-binding protein
VQNGTVECAHTASNFFAGKDETFAFNGIPFSLNTRQMNAWMYDGNGLQLMREFYRGYNVVNFPMGNTGAQMGGWYRKEIKSLDDMKGLKLRVSGLVSGRVYERLGVVPQIMDAGFREAQALYGELSAKNPNWKKVWNDYSKFRADQNLWFSFAEASMDNFLQAQKL